MSENWKDVLRAQHDDLAKLEAMDAELNENQISTDIDKLLKRPIRTDVRAISKTAEIAPNPPISNSRGSLHTSPPFLDENVLDDPSGPKSPTLEAVDQLLKRDENEKAPETADR